MKALNFNDRGRALFALEGYKTLGSKVEFSYELVEMLHRMSEYGIYDFDEEYESNLFDVVEIGKSILEKQYQIHDIDYCPADRVHEIEYRAMAISSSARRGETFDDFYKFVEDNVFRISPFELPVLLYDVESIAKIEACALGIPTKEEISKTKKYYIDILLGGLVTDLSASIYAHEITHSQIPIGGCLNYQNREVLSIFNEYLVAHEIDPSGDLLQRVMYLRSDSFKNCILTLNREEEYSKSELLNASVYVTSTLQAIHLFSKYVNGNDEEKDRIINGIQNVFDGKSTVEDLLSNNGITFNNSCNKELIKK